MTGRNDPCPCGSGKKYKKCCGKKAQAGGKPITATKLDPSKVSGLSNIFQQTVTRPFSEKIIDVVSEPPPIKPSESVKEQPKVEKKEEVDNS